MAVKYESLPEGANASLLFLNEDLDTIPERHAFLGNYRRFCSSIVESMVRKRPREAFEFILSRVDVFLNELQAEQPVFRCGFCSNDIYSLLSLTISQMRTMIRTIYHS